MTTNENTDASASTTSNDNGPDRNDSLNSTDQSADMDDTTGSNGGSTEDRFSGELDDTDDSGKPTQSRSDSARVVGMGISGGSGDSDTAQSGGRSQY